ncbi:MAG: hypothetical protein ACFNS8_03090, partial [Kingella oralis]
AILADETRACWQSTFWRLLRHKTASAALKTLANGRHWLAFSPCICHFLTQNSLQKLNANTPSGSADNGALEACSFVG